MTIYQLYQRTINYQSLRTVHFEAIFDKDGLKSQGRCERSNLVLMYHRHPACGEIISEAN